MSRRLGWTTVLLTVAILAASGGVDWWADRDGSLPDHAEATYSGGDARAFRNLGELAAASRFVLRGEVVAVEQGGPVDYQDGTGPTVIPRQLVVEVDEQLFARNIQETLPDRIRVFDGYWDGRTGYASEMLPWAQPGDTGYFFVTRGRKPDGEVDPVYSVLGSSGRVLVTDGRVQHELDELWEAAGSPDTAPEVSSAVAAAVKAARSGEAKPVFVTVCFPSVPGDENSEPACVEE